MRLWGPNGPAEVMPALSHGWWKGLRGPKPLTADFRDQGRGFNVLSVDPRGCTESVPSVLRRPERLRESIGNLLDFRSPTAATSPTFFARIVEPSAPGCEGGESGTGPYASVPGKERST